MGEYFDSEDEVLQDAHEEDHHDLGEDQDGVMNQVVNEYLGNSSDEEDDVSEDEIELEEEAQENQPQLRVSTRVKTPSTRYPPTTYSLLADGGEPLSFEEALQDSHKEEWQVAMKDEMESLHKNGTYQLVKRPRQQKVLKNKWVYKVKHDESNPLPRYKARDRKSVV